MQRGILKLTNHEAEELLKNFNLRSYTDTPLAVKLGSIDLSNPEIEILLSEDELENIMDEIGAVDEHINPGLFSAINKITELMTSFRV